MDHDATSLAGIHVNISDIYTVYHQVHPPTTWQTRQASRPVDGLALVLDGSAAYDFGGRHVTVGPGDVLCLRKGDAYISRDGSLCAARYTIILVNFEYADPRRADTLPLSARMPLDAHSPVPGLFDEMLATWTSGAPFARIQVCSLLYGILYHLCLSGIRNELHIQNLSRIIESVRHMENRYREPVTLAALAELSNLSPSHFIRLFTGTYGIPPMEYLNRVRIKHAKILLRSGIYTIGEIAENTGFHSLHYFSRVFRQHEGVSPSMYRQAATSDRV